MTKLFFCHGATQVKPKKRGGGSGVFNTAPDF